VTEVTVDVPEDVVLKFVDFCRKYDLAPSQTMSEAFLEYIFHHDREKLVKNRKRMLTRTAKACSTAKA
jgi:hypothetical protein